MGAMFTFVSSADNLVADDTNEQADVFVQDRESGETKRVSIASDGQEAEKCSGGAFHWDIGELAQHQRRWPLRSLFRLRRGIL